MSASQHRIAYFVRGFFIFLKSRQMRAAVIHGGDDGFERELSDVDFVVSKDAFKKLPTLIDAYCNQSAWRLCQILRHETTAAYFVCSAADDPACAVALDACSDYQRNGTLFISAAELLENRELLAWGGYCLTPAYELRYRFAKAASKNKNAVTTAIEFANYSENIRYDCASWLHKNWNIVLKSWDAADLAPVLEKFRAKSNQRPSLLQKGALGRIFFRILRPTGLILMVGHHDFEATAASFESVFGHLYFRRFRKAEKYSALFLKDLVTSTLIVVPQLGFPVNKLLPANCIYHLNSAHDPDTQCREIALYLHERCKKSGFY